MSSKQDFETRFSEVGKNIDEMVADTREDYREERQALKEKWNTLDAKRKGLSDKGDSVWEDVKDEFEEGWKDIKDSYEDVKENFTSKDHTGHNH